MTPMELAEIEARANAATPGPWEVGVLRRECDHPTTNQFTEERSVFPPLGESGPVALAAEGEHENGAFIAHARTDVPALIAQVKRLTDDPAKDDTDEAHPAWWRGYNADKGELACLTDVARAEARAAHAKVALLEAERDEARSKQRFAEFDASRLRAENATLRSSTEPTR